VYLSRFASASPPPSAPPRRMWWRPCTTWSGCWPPLPAGSASPRDPRGTVPAERVGRNRPRAPQRPQPWSRGLPRRSIPAAARRARCGPVRAEVHGWPSTHSGTAIG
jgi:hypothetical protein